MGDPNSDLIEQRRDYTANTLSSDALNPDPLLQFSSWMLNAREEKILDATAMALCTADSAGQPHVRMVLLKKAGDDGFTWYTYQQSDKGRELEQNPQASLLFYWRELERQVRIEGLVTKLEPADADEYFYSRPDGSRFSAAASVQSSPVASRKILEQEVDRLRAKHPDGNVPKPEVWGGYQLKPSRFEFWQGRADRLHDRFIYTRDKDGVAWNIQRLSP